MKMSTLPPLSALATFDDIMRCTKELTSGIAEESEYKLRVLKKFVNKTTTKKL